MEYVLEIKQIVDYPRIRIYREFVQNLINHSNLSSNGDCNLFNYIVLCSYANYTSSRKRLDGKEYRIRPGSWICRIEDLMKWFHLSKEKSLGVLAYLESLELIEYYCESKWVFYRIIDWDKYNSCMEYEAHCHKDNGFFFFSHDLIDVFLGKERKSSDKDVIMDLWLNAIYNDNRVDGPTIGPVVYYRNNSGNPRTSYSILAKRWNKSKATVCRLLEKLQTNGYITYLNFSGRYGTAIYLNGYLSIMFEISDVPVDKKEVALALNLKIDLEEEETIVSKEKIIVSKSELEKVHEKVREVLILSGFECMTCKNFFSILYRLSLDCTKYIFKVLCRDEEKYKFIIELRTKESG